MVRLGIEQLLAEPPAWMKNKKLGLLCNQASTDSVFRHSRDLIYSSFPGSLTCLFSPQHGFFCEKQDNMIESGHALDAVTGLPVFSLYGETREPSLEMFDHIDILLVDLIDVGTRVYTFMYTLAYCLQAAARFGKKVVVLDRPNPIGGELIEGNLVADEYRSFVGLYAIPMRYGLTLGELGRLFNTHFGIRADYDVIRMDGWQRQMSFGDTGLPWLFPSPNMPAEATALVYPGQVIWEGTNISEGRGTTLPFEIFGAPFIDYEKVGRRVSEKNLPGCILRPLVFQPTSNKWAGQDCKGFQLHVTDPHAFRPYRTSLTLLQAVSQLYPDEFKLKPPPYEYEYDKQPLDMILGSRSVRKAVMEGDDIEELEAGWQEDLQGFDEIRRSCFLY
ncbi:MAG: DUF1343 domain-containing protein [Desulfobulbaceae bacterium]|uniref:DUF1343 domain-containing protein n=1 Tax=Candidatus Desulfobia pelagia TaxID=2841692 RepID=A0A8J6N9T2_9BACT|nr:DUF1343 domain-containing protein [Candidatus Desulfobia pelagia]